MAAEATPVRDDLLITQTDIAKWLGPAALLRWHSLALGWRLYYCWAGLVATFAVLWVLPAYLPLPQVLTQQSVRAPTAMVANLIVVILVLLTLEEPTTELLATAVVNLPVVRMGRVLVNTFLAIAALALRGPPSEALAIAIATTMLVGEGMLLAWLTDVSLAWILPTAHLIGAMTFGVLPMGTVAPWALVISSSAGPGGLVVSGALFVVALTLWARKLR